MLEYDIFKAEVVARIKEFLPNTYENYEVLVHIVNKINQNKDCVNLVPPNDSETVVAMTNLYLDDLYEEYRVDENLDRVMHKAAAIVDYFSTHKVPELAEFHLKDQLHRIIFTLIHTSSNEKLLKTVPHRDILDLSVVYRFVMSNPLQGGCDTVLLTDELFDDLDLTQDELYEIAYCNTKSMFPVVFYPMQEAIQEMIGEFNIREDTEIEAMNGVYIVTNPMKLFGAVSVLFEEELYGLSHVMKGDFYLLPSSLHEMLAVPINFALPSELEAMVRSVNQEVVMKSDMLSNCVYYYNQGTRTLSFAKDTASFIH